MLTLASGFDTPIHQLPEALAVPPPAPASRRLAITPPGSKSLTNRALLLAALAHGTSRLRRPLTDADDAQRMLAAIRALGCSTSAEPDGTLSVRGVQGRWNPGLPETTLDLHNAGTATRFLAAACLLAPRPIVIDGNARMRQRPIGELAEALSALGCGVEYLGSPGCPPLRLTPPAPNAEHPIVTFAPTQSSQFISALLLVAPFLPSGLTLRLRGTPTSPSYIRMTLGLLSSLGCDVRAAEDLHTIRVPARPGFPAFDYAVEPDASGATYFWAAGAILPDCAVTVPGLGERSLQGDSDFPALLQRMGATVTQGPPEAPSITVHRHGAAPLSAIRADMTDMPDAAMTLAAVACFAPGPSHLRGIRTLRVKECDRVLAMQTELAKVGVRVESPVRGDDDALILTPPPRGIDTSPDVAPVSFQTYDDHRMAMALALIGLRRPKVTILDPGCVRKTYATFWADLARFYP